MDPFLFCQFKDPAGGMDCMPDDGTDKVSEELPGPPEGLTYPGPYPGPLGKG